MKSIHGRWLERDRAPVTEPSSGFRQKHVIEIGYQTRDNRTIVLGTVRSTGSFRVGTTGFCGTRRTAVVLRNLRGPATLVTAGGIEGIQVSSGVWISS